MAMIRPPASRSAVELEVQRVLELLRRSIAASGCSQKQLEQSLGWGEGYLSQLLTGKVDLKFRHFFHLAERLRLSPWNLLAELYGFGAPLEPGSSRADSTAEGADSPEGLRALVEEVVREVLAERQPEAPGLRRVG